MISGKVHGSLARAGKVKGQTPKVKLKQKWYFFCKDFNIADILQIYISVLLKQKIDIL